MHITNTRPLLDSLNPNAPGGQLSHTLRRNASGMLAENWLQQTYNQQDMRQSAPLALMQDFNSRVHGDNKDYQVDYQGEYSRYNDAFRERAMDNLDQLQHTYGKYGGKDATFTNQVRDLQNYMHFNKPPPMNPLYGSVPYMNTGPQTTFARQGALPPPMFAQGFNPMYAPYIDHDRKMLRTNMIAQKQTINELQEELHGVRREEQRFEDILHKGHQDIHRLNTQHFPGSYLTNGMDQFDPRKGMVKWGDAETDKTLSHLGIQEQELIRVLSKLPESSETFKQKRSKLDELVRQRSEIERMLHSKADHKSYLHERVVDDTKKDNLAQWLRRDLELFKIDKTDEDFIERKFRPGTGFLIYWDYMLNLLKEFKQVQLVYGIYNRGMTLFEPRLVPLTDTIDTTHPSFCQAIFNINHLVREIEAHPDVMLIVEIQVPAQRNTIQTKKSNLADAKNHTGYLLSRYGKIGSNGGPADFSTTFGDGEDEGVDPGIVPSVFQTFGWTVLDLFNFKNDLKRGQYKLPLYKPPTIINLDTRDIPQLDRIKDTMIWMRVAFPKDDEINEVRCEPAYYHMYYVPEIHNIAPKVQMHLKPERDPSYQCDGVSIFIHWVKGYNHQRHVRVGCALQLGKDVVLQENGHLCFYATKGIQYPKPKSTTPSILKGNTLKALNSQGRETRNGMGSSQGGALTAAQIYHNDPEKTVYFNENRTWYKDLYNMMWDLDLKENVYLILQYLERKAEVQIPTGMSVITRKLIEDEYDLIGYTVLQLNNPDGTIRYGSFILDFYDGPIFIEELDALKRNEKGVKVTIGKPGEFIPYTQGPPGAGAPKTPKSAQSIADSNSQVATPKTPRTPASRSKSRDQERPNKSRAGGSRNKKDNMMTPKSRDKDKPLSRAKSRGGEPKSPNNRSFKGQTPKSKGREEAKRPASKKGKKKKKKKKGPSNARRSAMSDYEYEDDEDIFDMTQSINDGLRNLDPEKRKRDKYFILNEMPQNTGTAFPASQGIDFYVDAARFLPDNATVSKIHMAAYTTEHQQISVSAGGLPDLESSTTFMHYYGFRYEFRLPKFHPQTVVVITIYTIDRTSNQVRTLGYSVIHLFLNRVTLLPCDNAKDREFVLQEGAYQLPIYIEDPRKLPELRAEALDYLERLPCSSLLIRVLRAPTAPNGSVLSAKTVPQTQWVERGVVVPAPDYSTGNYNTSMYRVTDVELEVFPSRADRVELPLKDTAEQLMQALSSQRSRNSNTLLDWLDQKLAVESEDPQMLDLKYFAVYDPDFGFKIAVDGIHNLPKRQNVFYIVIMSLSPPASLYTESQIPTNDVNLISTFDWDSSVLSVRYNDNYFYYQDVQPDSQMSVVFDVRAVEFVQGIPKIEQVAWSAIPVFFLRYGNHYVRSGAFQVPLFKGEIDYGHLQNMYRFEDPWNYLAQRLNERSIQLWEGVSLIVRMLDSQREGHLSRPFDFDRFNMVYVPEQVAVKLNYAYTGATEQRLKTTPKVGSMVPPNMDRMIFQEAVNRTFTNVSIK